MGPTYYVNILGFGEVSPMYNAMPFIQSPKGLEKIFSDLSIVEG